MWEVLLYALLSVLVILGLIELLRSLESLRLREQAEGRAFLVLPMSGDAEGAEGLLREGLLALDELPVQDGQIAIVDCGMSPELRQMCELFCRDYSCAGVFATEEICAIICEEQSARQF